MALVLRKTLISQMFPVRFISSHYTKVGGSRIHYVRSGTGTEPVLLLPGALGSALSDFSPQFEGISKDKFTLIGWDPPGYGKSRPPDRNFEDFFSNDANSAQGLMSELGYRQFSAVGWSDGGITGLILAARFPKSVKRLVVFGCNAYISEEDINMINQVADVSKWSERMSEPMYAMYGESFPTLWSAWCNEYKNIYNKGGDICSSDLKNISAPTLVIHGNKDVMVAEEHLEHLTSNIQNSRSFVFENGKHNLHFKYQKEFNSIVESFLTE
ncbi:valacyclovir hydrolase isoform X1 [Eurytemora carolleeae]|uniref:valacyclovir hydrolase isoform X1 n=1 Tax=Eurytemora carolleeae TaxID=1294199 RepID=UPI000C78DC50|nr:valacyclovir hydrolase isoform X1 [Eurytemora carolleeae]|eukprot:XP_023330697.1 valacyclovir hydrolase-like isoform X1 [Eurytemora affinis]